MLHGGRRGSVLKTRSGTAGEDNDFRELVGELGGLPLA